MLERKRKFCLANTESHDLPNLKFSKLGDGSRQKRQFDVLHGKVSTECHL